MFPTTLEHWFFQPQDVSFVFVLVLPPFHSLRNMSSKFQLRFVREVEHSTAQHSTAQHSTAQHAYKVYGWISVWHLWNTLVPLERWKEWSSSRKSIHGIPWQLCGLELPIPCTVGWWKTSTGLHSLHPLPQELSPAPEKWERSLRQCVPAVKEKLTKEKIAICVLS